jgi:hypothetical protein
MSGTTVPSKAEGQVQTFGRGRFSPGGYALDLSKVKAIPVNVDGQPSTFAEAYCKLRDSNIREMPDFFLDKAKYVTEQGEIELDCKWPLNSTMRKLADFTRQGIDPHSLWWFYYDHDWSCDADELNIFFVVRADKIIAESCRFGSDEPLILKRRGAGEEPIWHSHPYFDEAWERYWYRRFYSETLTGQLMVLRPDEPILYHFERPEARDTLRELQVLTLAKIYRLLWVALPLLAAVAFPAIRNYLAIAAAVLGVDFLWVWWKARKAGGS